MDKVYTAKFVITGDFDVSFITDENNHQKLRHMAREMLYGQNFNLMENIDYDLVKIEEDNTGKVIWRKNHDR